MYRRPSLITTAGIRRRITPLTLNCHSYHNHGQQETKKTRATTTTTISITTNIRKANMSTATSSSPAIKVKSLDHVVLTVKSLAATADFYTTHLGMQHETFKAGDGVER
jgi:catechol-2,3-dioxygenase